MSGDAADQGVLEAVEGVSRKTGEVSDILTFIIILNLAAPGFRERADGGLSYVGSHGFSYSSFVNGINGVYLDFYVTYLNPSYASSRAYGLQLRCLSE